LNNYTSCEPRHIQHCIAADDAHKMVAPIPSLGPVVERTWILPFAAVMETLAFIFIAIRLASRIHPTHAGGRLGIDDLFIVIGWIFQMASTVLMVKRKSFCSVLSETGELPIIATLPWLLALKWFNNHD
jgi:hypothetical protein